MYVYDYYIWKKFWENIYEWSWLLASSKDDAMNILEEDFNLKGQLQRSPVRSNQKKDMYRLSLYVKCDINTYLRNMTKVHNCKLCNRWFRKMTNKWYVYDWHEVYASIIDTNIYCSIDCLHRSKNLDSSSIFINSDYWVIYKITQKTTGMCYVWQTIRSRTLRRREHFTQGTSPKFQQAINSSDLTDRTFEIIEKVDKLQMVTNKNLLTHLEQKRIIYYDSINNWFNTVWPKYIGNDENRVITTTMI